VTVLLDVNVLVALLAGAHHDWFRKGNLGNLRHHAGRSSESALESCTEPRDYFCNASHRNPTGEFTPAATSTVAYGY